ncbi:glycosyl hydrolase family 28-related protein [Crateriforma conspicua]|uniref:glycosyl hydrolase family 28-related protein n=1 Tax=Crateriforma conspicua TaxID=2527996 RepID=UPI001189AC8D|nr:glycosyl hydrolase family 28-related protein [Crateriforma conspicua]QDV66002.1 Pectate lyase superfamily protein [Crateriforma conspicua]
MAHPILRLSVCILLVGVMGADARSAEDPDRVLASQPLSSLGMIDVTAPPFGADPTGKGDSTKAIQRAILFARDAQMVTYFPKGTYVVSDTLRCLHGRWDPDIGKLRNTRDLPCILVGDRSTAERPMIRLADHSAGYDDPTRPKHVVRFWAFGSGREQPTSALQPNINMNQMMIGIDVSVGQGNPGAVAIRHRAAQGSSIQDCTIDARGGLTGLEGGAGSGGSHFGITVVGGKVGIDYSETQPAPTLAGITLIDQEQAAIVNGSRQALTVVGCRIETNGHGPVIVTRQKTPHHGQLSMVDSTVDFKKPGENVVIDARAAVTLHDVYVRGASTVVQSGQETLFKADQDGWIHVQELAAALPAPPLGSWTPMPGFRYGTPVILNGNRSSSAIHALVDSVNGPPKDLVTRHLWRSSFPSWQSPGAVNVAEPPYGARGDGRNDDTEAIQRAVDENRIVFLPKGVYKISRPIRLRSDTALIGVGRCYTWIEPLGGKRSAFVNPADPMPLIQTADDAQASTTLAFFGLATTLDAPGAYCLNWRCGGASVYRSVNVDMPAAWKAKRLKELPQYDFPLVRITGNGGGSFYNFHQESWALHGKEYRHVLIEGTRQPLRFYQCNPEHARSDANMEIRSASDVSVFGVKGEYQTPIIRMVDSEKIRIFGYGGNASAWPRRALFEIQDCSSYLLTNLVDSPRLQGAGSADHFAGEGSDPRTWSMVQVMVGGKSDLQLRPADRPVLIRRGDP